MKELNCDLFSLLDSFDAICITTNSVIGSDGRAVMGAGCALECAKRWPATPEILASLLTRSERNIPFQLGIVTSGVFTEHVSIDSFKSECRIFSFPTKYDYLDKSDLDLIKASCHYMVQHADNIGLDFIALGRIGCGYGGLLWNDVKPVIAKILDERFYIVHLDGK